jgi:GNAT superfamily N-acetyltransferase
MMVTRLVQSIELHRALDVIGSAFAHDPIWSWAFPDSGDRRRFLTLFIDGAMRFRSVFKTAGFEAVSAWTPPNEPELTQYQEASIPNLLIELAKSRAPEVAELLRRFEEAHPRSERHYYLGLVGVDTPYKGHGFGMALLRDNLNLVDIQKRPAYLESSNPANNHRYESLGFKAISSFQAPGDGPTVTGKWREKVD